MKKPDLKVVMVPVGDLRAAEYNPRAWSEKETADLDASLDRFGVIDPLLVNANPKRKNIVIGGHFRLSRMLAKGHEYAPVIYLDLTEKQERELNVRLNKNTGHFDIDKLLANYSKPDLFSFGFTDLDFSLATVVPAAGDADDAPEPPKKATTLLGDVWILGDHRLGCGDSSDPATVARLLGNDRPHLMVTDPPYGVDYDPKWREAAGVNTRGGKAAKGMVMNDNRSDWQEVWALFPGDVAYVWHGHLHAGIVGNSLQAIAFELRYPIVWNKSSLVIGRGHYHWKHEACWYAVRKGGKSHWYGGRKQSTVWDIEHRRSDTGHGTQKPIECMKRPILNNSKSGDLVYDPFNGSGTTIIACEITGRRCRAGELSPVYVDVSVERWETFSGKKAVLESTGQTFAEVQKARSAA